MARTASEVSKKVLGSLLSGTIGEIGFNFSLIMFTRKRTCYFGRNNQIT
jgi:hypothetical protein